MTPQRKDLRTLPYLLGWPSDDGSHVSDKKVSDLEKSHVGHADDIIYTLTLAHITMSVLDKFRKGAAKAGIQATTFLREGSSRVQSSSQSFAQGFSLPGEAEKAAKILATFLGLCPSLYSPKFSQIFSRS